MARHAGTRSAGKFITFEGIEGCGKTTHITLLAEFLRRHGKRCLVTREPGGTPLGEDIRGALLKKRRTRVDHRTELHLYMAARAQLVLDVIKPALSQGQWVLCDRYLDSSLCYQGYGARRVGELELIQKMGDAATRGLKPDLTLLLDIGVRTGLARTRGRKARPDRIESQSFSFHRLVREGYRKLKDKYPKRIKMIQVSDNDSIHYVQEQIREKVTHFLK